MNLVVGGREVQREVGRRLPLHDDLGPDLRRDERQPLQFVHVEHERSIDETVNHEPVRGGIDRRHTVEVLGGVTDVTTPHARPS